MDEILNLFESVSERFPSYFFNCLHTYNKHNFHKDALVVGWFGLNGPLRQYCSLYRAVDALESKLPQNHKTKHVYNNPYHTPLRH